MSRRSGQSGQVFIRAGNWVGRYYEDASWGRKRPAVILGSTASMTKPEARRKLLDLLTERGINSSEHLDRALATLPTLAKVAEEWEASRLPHLARSSQYISPRLLKKHIVPFLGSLPVADIKTGDINRWIAQLRASPKTCHNLYKLLRAVVSWHYRQTDKQPPRWSPDLPPLPDQEQRWFTPEEAAALIEAAEEPYKTLFLLAFATGCRAGELFGLRAEDFDFERRVVRIVRSVYKGKDCKPKSRNAFREIFLDEETAAHTKSFLASRKGRVFITKSGRPMEDGDVVIRVLHPLCERLKIPPGGLHAFRHGRVSLLRVSAAPDDLIKRQIGHSSLKTTSGYTHFSESFQRELADRLSWTLGLKRKAVKDKESDSSVN